MALIGHYHEDLTAIVSSPKAISHYKQLGFNINWMRLYQLLDFRKIECGHESNYTGPAFPHPSMQSQMEYRPMLKKIHNFVKYLESKLELSQTSVCFNVNSVNIAGITICRNGRSIHIEVLDPFVCLDNSSRPVGFMECKIRLLEKMKSTYLLVDQEHLNKGEEKLFAWMEDEIVRLYMIQ
ncbi:Hypothetical predicted protein [Cloeon dipterum]|uniref:Uncharacterized protein n=1 Tax=Cloeon dipterum TaxID=197152 RepID=A0A8S1C6N3_9INSE|nr:Hypothetical predicted protein [Cloeon dipterum]